MNEIPKELNIEEQKLLKEQGRIQQEQNEQYEQFMKDNPDEVIAPEDLLECAPEILAFEEMTMSFKSTYSLTELLSINYLSVEDAPNHPLRAPAEKALKLILEKMTMLKEKTNISPEKYKKLYKEYKILSRAVGIRNNNKVDHNR